MQFRGRVARRNDDARRSGRLIAVLLGFVIAGAIAGVLALVKSETAMIGVGFALLGALIGVVYDLVDRVDQRDEGDAHRSALLASTLDQKPWLLRGLHEIAASAKAALGDDHNANLFSDLIKAKIGETQLYMQDLRRGHVKVPVNDATDETGANQTVANQAMVKQIDRVKKIVRATTIPEIDTQWWLSRAGRDYLVSNQRAVKRGVSIQRIFLWDDHSDSSDLAEVIKQQLDAGVEVLYVPIKKVRGKELKTNMAIYDDLSYNDVVFNSEKQPIYVEYYLQQSDAEQAIKRFEQLRGIATDEVPGELTQVKQALQGQAIAPVQALEIGNSS
jgi:hypothetical protein